MKKIACRIALGLLILPLLVPGQSVPEKPLPPAEQMDKLFDFWNRLDQPGFAVVVVKDGQVVYQKAFGLACQEHAVPLTPNSLFNTANLAQVFVGQAVAMLEAQGKLSLDEEVCKIIPEIPDFGVPLKLRHLVTHTSGLRDWLPALQLAGRGGEEVTMAKVLKIVQGQKKLIFTPGERFQDSNTDDDLLAEAIRRVTGKPFSDWAFENMFKPLKMTRSQFRDNCRSILDDQAFSYNFTRQEYLRGVDNLSLVGSHSLFASIAELGKWLVDLDAGKVVDKGIYTRMFTPGKLDSGASTAAGYGVNIDVRGGKRRISKAGDWAGSEMQFSYFPDQRLGFVLLANWDYTPIDGFGEGIPEIFLPAPPAPPASAKPAPRAKTVKVRPAILDEYAGDYRLGPGQVFNISRAESQLVLSLFGQKFPLTTLSETEFSLDFAQARVTFRRGKAGKIDGLVWAQGGREQVAPKVVMVKPSPEELAEYAGAYVNDELGGRLALEVRGGGLALVAPEQAEVRLLPDEKDTFTSGSRTFPKIVFQRDPQGRVTGLIIDSAPVRDLLFKKG
jgi:CubicO group peptidase (beta-lactamase class C family)